MKLLSAISPARRRWLNILIALALLMFVIIAANAYRRLNAPLIPAGGAALVEIKLSGPASTMIAEISGMAWYGDWLVLLPQYPGRFDNQLYALPRGEIAAYLASGGEQTALAPRPIAINSPDLERLIPGFQGYEAIAFNGERFYLTIEAESGGKMSGYLVGGQVQPGDPPAGLTIDTTSLQTLLPQAELNNHSDEALVIFAGQAYTFYESNGANLNPQPQARVFDLPGLTPAGAVSFPNIEYRLTDASPPDAQGRFWAINYLFPGDVDKLRPAADPFSAEPLGDNPAPVERLIPLQITPAGVVIDRSRAAIHLELLPDGTARNWEALAPMDDDGLLLATDTFPRTMLVWLAMP
jgi:hypothetical protein